MALGSIVVRLTMNTADFETDTARAAKIAERRAAELDAAFKKAGIAIGLALSAAVIGVTKAVKDSIDHMDELSKAAQRVGMPTEQFSQLAYAGDLADVSMEDLQSSMGRLMKSQAEALKSTSQQARIFAALGISATDASGKLRGSLDVLYDFADAFKEQKGSPEIIAAGLQLFGRSFQNLIPLLKDGSAGLREAAAESDALGKTLSTQAGQQAEQFNDNLTRLKTAIGGLAQNVAADLLPDLVRLTDRFVDLVKEGNGVGTLAHDIADGFRIMGSAAESSITLVSGVATVVGGLTQQLAGFYEMAAALGNFDWERRAKGAAMYQAGGAQVGRGVDRLVNPHGANGLFGGTPLATGSYDGPLLTPSKALADAEFAQEVERIRQQRAHAEALRKALGDPEPAARKVASGLNEQAKAAREAASAMAALERADDAQMRKSFDQVDAGTDAIKHWADMSAQLAGPIAQAELDHIKRTIDIENTAKAAGVSARDLATALDLEGAAHQRLIKDLKEQAEAMQNPELVRAMDSFRGIAEDFLVDLPREGGKAWKQFGDDLERLLLRLAAQDIIKSLFGNYGTTGSGTAGGGLVGAILSGLFGGGRASGGPVSGSRIYEVGEGGNPELLRQGGRTYLIPGADGEVVPASNGAMGAPSMGGLKVEINNYAGARVSAREEVGTGADGQAMRKLVLDIVRDDINSGGGTARDIKQRFGLREPV